MKEFSFSSLETHKKCPAQFKIKYIDKVRKSDEGIEAFMGKRVHETLEYLYNEVLDGSLPIFDQVVDRYNSNWQDKWHDRIGIVRIERSSDYYRNLGEACIARYYRRYSPFNQPIVGNEIDLIFPLDDNGEYMIKGIIDRLDHDGNGNWVINDYKSGKRILSQDQADKDNQLALYQIGLLNKDSEINSVKLAWHFLQFGIEIESYWTEQQLQDLSEKLIKQIDGIRSQINTGGEFPAKKSILCNWCYYWEECLAQIGPNPFIK